MKNHRYILVFSLLLNAALLLVAMGGYAYYRFERMRWEMEAPPWALYAGTMQAVTHHENGVKRLLRLTPATTSGGGSTFTGDREDGVEVWTWIYQPALGESARLSSESFVTGYNNRMRNFLAEATSRPSDAPAD